MSLKDLIERFAAVRAKLFGLPTPVITPEPIPSTILFSGPAGPVTTSPYPLTVDLSDGSGVTRVNLFKGAGQIAQLLAPPYTWPAVLTAADNGQVHFRAVVIERGRAREVDFTVAALLSVPVAPAPLLTLDRATASTGDTITASLGSLQPGDQLDWGDGVIVAASASLSHSYSASGPYTVRVLRAGTSEVGVALTVSAPPSPFLTRSRKRSDYTLPNTPVTVTKAALLGGVYGSPNSEGWYEIPDVRCHSLTPGVPCILVKAFDIDLKVKIIRPVLDGLGTPGTNVGGLIVSEAEGSVWVDDFLVFSSPPPVGGNGVKCNTARTITMNAPRELITTRGESYGTGGTYVDTIAQGGKFRGIHVDRIGGYNIRGTGYNEDGTVRLVNGRIDTSLFLGYKAQIFQLNNAPDAPDGSVVVENWVAHNDPMAMIGRNAGQREDVWNTHASAGTIYDDYLEENGLPYDPNFTGVETVYGVDPASPSGRGYSYSGSAGLGDGFTKNEFSGTAGPNDVTHNVRVNHMLSLNNANVGLGVTAGNRSFFFDATCFTAGIIRSNAPGGYSRLAVKPAPAPSGETGSNACQAYQMYLAHENAALFYGHEMDNLRGAFCWMDADGTWHRNIAYIDDPNGSTGSDPNKIYNSIKFRQNGVELPPFNGGIVALPTPTSPADALAKLDALRQDFIASRFTGRGKVIGMSDRPLGDVNNYWAGVP